MAMYHAACPEFFFVRCSTVGNLMPRTSMSPAEGGGKESVAECDFLEEVIGNVAGWSPWGHHKPTY